MQLPFELSKTRLLLIGGGLVTLVIIPLLLFAFSPSQPPLSSQSVDRRSTTISASFPIPPTHNLVRTATINYVLQGAVQDLRTTSSGTFLTLSGGTAIPALPLTPTTRVSIRGTKGRVNIGLANIRQGAQVMVHALYNMKNREWSVLLVEIIRQ